MDTFGFGSSVIPSPPRAVSALVDCQLPCIEGHAPGKVRLPESCKGTLQNVSQAAGEWGSCLSVSCRQGQENSSYESATLWLVEMAP